MVIVKFLGVRLEPTRNQLTGFKGFQKTNTLAYLSTTLVTSNKSYITSDLGDKNNRKKYSINLFSRKRKK
jgi:hypothetical protein